MSGFASPKPAAPRVHVAGADEREAAIGVISAAFVTDPIFRWIFPAPADYLTHAASLVEVLAGRAFDHEAAFLAEGRSGAALWLPPGVRADAKEVAATFVSAVDPARIEEIGSVMGGLGDYHPEGDCWYLPLVGVDPFRQGQGVGSALLRASLERVDASGLPAHLESSNEVNLPLYQRFGFEIIEEVQDGDSPRIWPMTRPSR